MRRKSGWGQEILIAVVAGLLIALGITGFLFFTTADEPDADPSVPSPTATPLTALPEKTPLPIEILDLENESVVDNKSLSLRGRTFPKTPVVIFVEGKSFVTQSDETGNFSLNVNLNSGSNVIEAVVVDENNQQYADERLVVYTNKSLDEILLTESEIASLSAQDE